MDVVKFAFVLKLVIRLVFRLQLELYASDQSLEDTHFQKHLDQGACVVRLLLGLSRLVRFIHKVNQQVKHHDMNHNCE